MAGNDEKNNALEGRFCSFFAGADARTSKKGNIEENLVWGYLVHHLDEAKVSSSDLALVISADYYAGFLSEKDSIYHALNSGRESLLEHLAGNFSEFNTSIKSMEIQPASDAEADKNFSLVMLWQTYLSLLKHKGLAQMVNDADDIADLKGIVFLDVLADFSGGGLEDMIKDEITIRKKAAEAMGRYGASMKKTKADDAGDAEHDEEPDNDPDETPYRIRRPRPGKSTPNNFLKIMVGSGVAIALAACVGYFGFFHQSEKMPAEQVKYKEELVYIVERKDTLRKISGRVTGNKDNYGLIAEYNDIENPNHIDVGQAIAIPKELAVKSDQLHKIRFSQQGSLGRYYTAVEGERFEDIVDYVTGSRHNSGIILEYNRWINPGFDTSFEKEEKIYFPQELIMEERALPP